MTTQESKVFAEFIDGKLKELLSSGHSVGYVSGAEWALKEMQLFVDEFPTKPGFKSDSGNS